MNKIRNGKNCREETLLNTNRPNPLRGEIWYVNFDPTIGTEIRRQRPAVVVSSDAVGVLPIKLIAPITGWKEHYSRYTWHVRIEPDSKNGLCKVSTVDTLQLRGVDIKRFVRKIGRASPIIMEEIAATIAAVVEYQ
ncbi:TPA: type II toxin-antitoxin system PemK/MazF family toxin [Candidatus Poribacteria bacterium]|nr:type II toxin-antitoxin system PemK/MazF family toxin [Candidatus Poribacteria bacterium]